MSVYVDDMKAHHRNMIMCHMMADTLEELHAMAHKLNLKKSWLHDSPRHPHYDLSLSKRAIALRHGAIEVTQKELVIALRGKYKWNNEEKRNYECKR